MDKATLQQIEEKLMQAVTDIMSLDKNTVTAQTPLPELGIDSLGLVEIFVFIENNFKLQLLESGLTREDIKTIHSLACYVHTRL